MCTPKTLLFLQKDYFFNLVVWIILDYTQKILYNNKVKVLQLIHMGKWEDIKMLDQITWGTPGSLLCLGFFFAGLGIFLRSITSYSKNK
ncbi:hypothetical protein COK69_23090 [Bacillus cereus]|nr:hypothetical protein COK69_23090 [Bacillus cereus]